jgi:hypothetical protein
MIKIDLNGSYLMNRIYISLTLLLAVAPLQGMQKPSAPAALSTYKFDKKETECCICIDQIKIGQKYTCLPCEHVLHFNCYKDWAKTPNAQQKLCPLCRAEIADNIFEKLKREASDTLQPEAKPSFFGNLFQKITSTFIGDNTQQSTPEQRINESHLKNITEKANRDLEGRLKQANDTVSTLRRASITLQNRLNGAEESAKLLQKQRDDANDEISGLNIQNRRLTVQNNALTQRVNRSIDAYRNQINRHDKLRRRIINWGSFGIGIASGILAHNYLSASSHAKYATLLFGSLGWISSRYFGHLYADSSLAADNLQFNQSSR